MAERVSRRVIGAQVVGREGAAKRIDVLATAMWAGMTEDLVRDAARFDNTGANGVGDGAYLFDPQGDLRAWMTYPCRLGCTDPYTGALELTADATGDGTDLRADRALPQL